MFSRSLLALATLLPLHVFAASPSATVADGVVVGLQTSIPGAPNKVNVFHGIPFAEPPLKDLRFAPPVAPKKWSKPLMTKAYKPSCWQQFNYPAAARNLTIELFNTPGPPAGQSEDCLYIDVYAPASGKGKAVLFWIYGGGLQFGSNSVWAYNGTSFAANQDVIVAIPNYRTNVFGYSGAGALPITSRNAGFFDQHMALKWVHDNIAAFGGDPSMVTIFGESAGSVSVDDLITVSAKNPMFRAAIMESGTATFDPPASLAAAPKMTAFQNLSMAVGCKQTDPTAELACMRSKPAPLLLNTLEHMELAFNPEPDNLTMSSNPTEARITGKIARVPLLIGNNLNEGRVFTVGDTNITEYLLATFPGAPQSFYQEVMAAYPFPTPAYQNSYQVIAQIDTDFTFWCLTANAANSSATQAKLPTWRYLYNASFPNTQTFQGEGVYHSSEIVNVFGTYPVAGATPDEMSFSAFMQKTWADFAKDPMQGPGWAKWPTVGVLGVGDGKGGVSKNVTEMMAGYAGVDARCAIYQPVYAAVGVPPP